MRRSNYPEMPSLGENAAMPTSRDLQFAVVREDPAVETELLRHISGRRVLLIASGGCTLLHLASEFPHAQLTGLDGNPAQIQHVRAKLDALSRSASMARWQQLSQCGNFESLFRGLRLFLEEMVAVPSEWEQLLQDCSLTAGPLLAHKYWPVAFELFFHDKLLVAMFGPHAIQHATPGSYPRYFQNVFEAGLKRPDRVRNYFLHHALLGRYLPQALPAFLLIPPAPGNIRLMECAVEQTPDFSCYDLISLSNLFDWMEPDAITKVTRRLSDEVGPGSVVLVRQLNNDNDLRPYLRGFRFDTVVAERLLASDRSLFYNRLLIAIKEQA